MLNEANQVIDIPPSSEMPPYFFNQVWLILIARKLRMPFPPLSHFFTSKKRSLTWKENSSDVF